RDRTAMRLAAKLQEVRAWSVVTRKGEIGELAGTSEEDPVWGTVTSTRDNCLGLDCPRFDGCHVMEARREAQAADIVVVNHHLLMADLVLKDEGFGDLLPGADAIVIDEAHQLPEIAANFLGFAVSSRQLQALSRDVAAELLLSGARQELPATFAQTLERHLYDLQDALRGPRERTEFKDWPASVIESIDRLQSLLDEFVSSLTEAAKDHAGLAALRRRGAELAARLRMLVAADEGEEASV